MRDSDRRDYIERYRGRLTKFGYSPETLGWGKEGRQAIRYSVLTAEALMMPQSSVLDVGCGFADLYDFMISRGWCGQYTGIDIVPELIDIAGKRHPNIHLFLTDITDDNFNLGTFDFVIASGVFNAELPSGGNERHIIDALTCMNMHAKCATSVDFMSTYVDYRKDGSWHTDPGWVFFQAKKLSKRILLRHDYMPYEFAVTIYRDDQISPKNIFQKYEYYCYGSHNE